MTGLERTLYGTTWNGNPSGRLWECHWYVYTDGTGRAFLSAPGAFMPPKEFADVDELAAAFDAEAAEFFGQRAP